MKDIKYYCDFCDRTDKKGCNEFNDEYLCDDCYQDMIGRAEMRYDAIREEGLK